ncbi:hypothetical protein U9M48_020988 [Paspalum notatum var. saurae]|uniref:DNA topoisomerase 2 n=1 Tax=Paspalum notatum var. saurae TaxID=547442 RepID=A0AAQ3TFE0_PASNO
MAEGGEMTAREHMILRPHDYIGSVDKCTRMMWVFEPTNQASTRSSLVHPARTYVLGLYKIFDEVLIYAADNKQRDRSMDSLRVEVDAHQGSISIYYNGQGLPIELHPEEEGLYMPEMFFGHLQELTGGRSNSYGGVKLANLFSTEFVIETVDSRLEKKYKQIFSENMGKKSEPQITVCLQGVNWTRITFKPDLAKFHMTHLDDDVIALMGKRVLDMAGLLDVTVQVAFNGTGIRQFDDFMEYAVSYAIASSDRYDRLPSRLGQRINDNLGLPEPLKGHPGLRPPLSSVSFVNKFATTEGGTHVDFVSNLIAHRVAQLWDKYLHYQATVDEFKKHLFILVNVVMENPSFNSPLRDALTSMCQVLVVLIFAVLPSFSFALPLISTFGAAPRRSTCQLRYRLDN